jgi:hypothetical protein
MKTTLLAVAAAAGLLAACGDRTETGEKAEADRTEGPVVSSSEPPRNQAIDTTPKTPETTATPGANSYTEAQAKGALEAAGYTGVGALTQNAQGLWQGKATKDGKSATVSVDYKGAITTQ